jgi:hypothetical protein
MAQLLGNLNDLALRNKQMRNRIDEFALGIGMGYSANRNFRIGSALHHTDSAGKMELIRRAFISALFAHGRELLQRSYGSSFYQSIEVQSSRWLGLLYLENAVMLDCGEKNMWLDRRLRWECKYIWWLFGYGHEKKW